MAIIHDFQEQLPFSDVRLVTLIAYRLEQMGKVFI
jgi:hypothetical protein